MKETAVDESKLEKLKQFFAPDEKIIHIEQCSRNVFADRSVEFVFQGIMILFTLLTFLPIIFSTSGAARISAIVGGSIFLTYLVALFVIIVIDGLKPRYMIFTDESFYLTSGDGAETIHYGNIDRRIKVGAKAIYIECEVGSGMEYSRRSAVFSLLLTGRRKRKAPYRQGSALRSGSSRKTETGGFTVSQMIMDPAYSGRYDPDIKFIFRRFPIENGIALATQLMKIEKDNKKHGKNFPLLVVPVDMKIDDEVTKRKW